MPLPSTADTLARRRNAPGGPRPALTDTDAILTELRMASQIPALRAAGTIA